MIRRPSLSSAVSYFGEAAGRWMGLGLIAMTAEVGLALLRGLLTETPKGSESAPTELPVPQVVDILSGVGLSILGFILAGGLLRAALTQLRGGRPQLGHFLIDGQTVLTLVALAVPASLGSQGLGYAIYALTYDGAWGWPLFTYTFLNWVLTVPFLIAIPFVVDRGLRPIDAANASVKGMTSRFFSALGQLIVFYLAMVLMMIPMACILGAVMTASREPLAVLWSVAFMALWGSIFLPIYYLWVALVYSDVAEVPSTAM